MKSGNKFARGLNCLEILSGFRDTEQGHYQDRFIQEGSFGTL